MGLQTELQVHEVLKAELGGRNGKLPDRRSRKGGGEQEEQKGEEKKKEEEEEVGRRLRKIRIRRSESSMDGGEAPGSVCERVSQSVSESLSLSLVLLRRRLPHWLNS